MNRLSNRHTDEQMNRKTNENMDEQTDRQTNGWIKLKTVKKF